MNDESISLRERSIPQCRIDLAKERDARARELNAQFRSSWVELGSLCATVKEQEDWKVLGFHSWTAWLQDAVPAAASTAFLAVQIRESLKDMTDEELSELPIGSAKVLASVPKRSRTKKLMDAAKESPAKCKALVQDEMPELHIESTCKRRFEFTRSQERIIDEAIEKASVIESGEWTEENIPEAEALTLICEDYIDRHRPTYEKIKRGK
jgi:hypothetical protein